MPSQEQFGVRPNEGRPQALTLLQPDLIVEYVKRAIKGKDLWNEVKLMKQWSPCNLFLFNISDKMIFFVVAMVISQRTVTTRGSLYKAKYYVFQQMFAL